MYSCQAEECYEREKCLNIDSIYHHEKATWFSSGTILYLCTDGSLFEVEYEPYYGMEYVNYQTLKEFSENDENYYLEVK